ncbi:MAG: ExeM/NucH family extracellular endonuclease [Acidimicrobiia bacterium]
MADAISGSVINFNGDDAVVLRKGEAVVDAFGQVGTDPGSEWAGGGQNDTLRRKETVCAGDTDETDAFDASVEWDMFAQDTFDGLGSHTANCTGGPPPPPVCVDSTFDLIHDIQGNGLASPIAGDTGSVEAVVTGDFQNNAGTDNGDLGGFFIQEEDGDVDADPTTSEGIFVFSSSPDVQVGDKVQVEGVVNEFFDLTEISPASSVIVCSSGNPLPTPASVTLPVTSLDDLEAFEGMGVVLPQNLTISEYFNFDRFGEIVLSTDRQVTPTALVDPGPDAVSLAEQYSRSRITLDDGRSSQNPDPAIHPNGGIFDLANLFRGGDRVANVTGVMDYQFGLYRIQPTEGADYAASNPRPTSPADVGGNLKVASFNVLNYFTTLDNAGPICGPAADQDCRGADNATELTRQRDKIVAAISEINADVVGLIEIENHPADVPTADLVTGLNAALGAGTYDYIATGAIGTDAIRVAMIYKPASVTPVGPYAILDSSVDSRFLDDYNRPVLAQPFQDNETGGVFTLAVNHLKSKGSDCNAVGDPDLGDGAGNCNLTRTAAAQALVDWLATDPTGSSDSDFLIMGDLNSYDKEAPIDAILAGADDAAGGGDDYTDLIHAYLGENAYSYVFDGQVGYLDHALAGSDLVGEVTGTTVWHINADEPDLIDYDTSFKQPAQDALYAPDPYRASDHDPVIVGLGVCDEIAPTIEVSVTPDRLWPANHKYVDVTVSVTASDNFDSTPTVSLVSVASNEPDNGSDDGNTVNDIVKVNDYQFKLRAERSGSGSGRVYTITYKVVDDCGNSTIGTATVTVPLNNH